MGKTSDLISEFQPQWGNKHADWCDVTKHRTDLWSKFVKDPTDGALYGAVIEYDGGGDQERENCTCGRYPEQEPEDLDPLKHGTYLSIQARALAVHIDAFTNLIARDVNTHDGVERGEDWSEESRFSRYINGTVLDDTAKALRELADLWDFG